MERTLLKGRLDRIVVALMLMVGCAVRAATPQQQLAVPQDVLGAWMNVAVNFQPKAAAGKA